MRGRTRWPRRDVTAWGPARLGALDRSERPARPRVAHQRSSRPATPPGRTPADSSNPAQETTTAGCEPVAREAGTPAACPRGPRSRQRRRPCSNHRREEQLPRDSGRRGAWAIYCSRPAPPLPVRVRPATARPRGADLRRYSGACSSPICAARSPSVVSPWSPGGSGRRRQANHGRNRGVRSSGSCGCMKWGPVQARKLLIYFLAGSWNPYLLSYILTLVCCRFRIISTSASCLKCSHQTMVVPRDVASGDNSRLLPTSSNSEY